MKIEISTNNAAIVLTLGTTVAEVRTSLASMHFVEEFDAELDRHDIELPMDGVSLIADSGILSCVFLHLDPMWKESSPFMGNTDLLNTEFFRDPSTELFEECLTRQGFVRLLRPYPFALDMMTSQVRLRYEYRPGNRMIIFDNGAFVREKMNNQ